MRWEPAVAVGGRHVKAADRAGARLRSLAVDGGGRGQHDHVVGHQVLDAVPHGWQDAAGQEPCALACRGRQSKQLLTNACLTRRACTLQHEYGASQEPARHEHNMQEQVEAVCLRGNVSHAHHHP